MIDVIYLAGGQGKRAKLGYPKQFARLGGKPIMIHGLEVLQQIEEINNIILVYPKDIPAEDVKIWPYFDSKFLGRIKFIPGGFTRQESVFNGLKLIRTSHVLIAEAVRPFINADFVRKIINHPMDFVVPVSPSLSSVLAFYVGTVYSIPRDQVGEVQMPQKFRTETLRHAHVRAYVNTYTDDASLLIEMTKERPVVIDGIEQNIKITTPLDLIIAEAIYRNQYHNCPE